MPPAIMRPRTLLPLLAVTLLAVAACRTGAPPPAPCRPAAWERAPAAPLLAPEPLSTRRGEELILLDWRWDEVGVAPRAQATIARPGTACEVGAGLAARAAELRLTVTAAADGESCSYEIGARDLAAAEPLRLDAVPPGNRLTTLERRGPALWAALQFNGYAAELPAGGNRVVAGDLCSGELRWASGDLTSNGPLLLVDDVLVTAYGFTAEPDHLFVLDAASGEVVQRLPLPTAAEELALTQRRLWVKTYDAVLSYALARGER